MHPSVKKQRSIDTSIALFSQDVDNYSFDITFTDLELQAGDEVEVLAKLQGGKLEHKSSATLVEVDGELIARYVFDTKLIDGEGRVFCYVYLKRGDKSADVGAFYFEVDLSELDKVGGKIAEVYDGRYEDLVAGFEIRLQEYRDSLPQASELRAEIDVILNQFGVDSQQAIDDLGEVSATVEIAEASRVEAETERIQAETERKEAELLREEAETLREDNYEQLIDTALIEADVVEKVDNKVTELTPQINNLTAQLAHKAQQIDQLERSKADKSDLKPILERTEKDNKEYVIESGRYGRRGESHRDEAFVRYAEFFGGYAVNGVIRNTNPIEYSFDVIFYDQEENYIERDRALTDTEYVVDERYLFRVAISRTDGASIVESDMPKIHDAFFISDRLHIAGNISGNIMLDKHSVKLENLADKQRITYPFPRNSLVIEQVEGEAVYFYADRIMVRNHSADVFFYHRDFIQLLSDYVAVSPSGGSNYIRIPEKKSLVYDVPEKTLKVVEWQEIKTTQDLLLLSNHDDLKGVLADYWKWSILEDVSTKVESLTTSDSFINIPKYWNAHINEKVNRIRSNQMSLGKDGFSFGFITDIHYNPRRMDYKVSSPYIMSKVMKDCSIKFFINGGDIGNQQNGENGREIIISDYYGLLGKFKDAGIIDQMMPLLGNHESNTQNWPSGSGDFDNVMVNNDEIYSIYFRNTERIHGISYGGDGTYYYVDDTPNQVRYVCLNTNDVEYTESKKIDYAIKQQQFDWLISEALELPNADWSVILASHIPPVTQDFTDRGMPVKNMELLKGVVKAFKNKSTFSNSESHNNISYNANVNVDFTGNENDFIVWISGHHHRDHVTLVDNSYTVVITPDDGRRNYDNPIKTIGTDTEHVMDFFTVDKINKKVFITRVGAGKDREFTY